MSSVGAPVDITALQLDPARAPLGWVAARPLLMVAIVLILGIAVSRYLPVSAGVWVGLSILFSILSVLMRRRPVVASMLILFASGWLGVSIAQLSYSYYRTDHITHFTTETRRLAQVEMLILHPPRIYAPTFGQSHPMPPKQVTTARVTAVRLKTGWVQASGDMLVQISEPNPRLRVGQTVRAWGMIDRPASSMNPGQFDWAGYYRQQRILVSLHVPHANNLIITEDHAPSLMQQWRAYTRDMLAAGFTNKQSVDHALLRALVLGDSDPELRDVQEQFRKTGTSHHLAISGMHIAVMGGVVFMIARLCRLSPRKAWMIAIVFVIAYGLAALPSAPVVRSVLLWVAIGIAILTRRGMDMLQLLAVVVIAMLVYQPLDLFNAGFQLSFGTVLGLIVLTKPMTRWFGARSHDPTESAPTRWIIRAAAYIDSQILLVMAAGLVAWLVSMPVIASHFSQLNPWAILSSIVIAPVVFCALIAGVFKIVLTALFPGLAGAFAWIAVQPTSWMRRGVEWLGGLPFGDVPLPAPTWWMIGLFYVSLLVAAYPWERPGARIITKLAYVAALLVLLFLPYRSTITQTTSAETMRVTLLAVGAGQCAVVEPPSGRITLIDAGSLSLADPVRRAIAPFLRYRGITQIDTIAVSHANSDHFSAVAELVEAYGAREVMVAPHFSDAATDNPMLAETMSHLRRVQRPPTTVVPGHIIPMGTNASLEVLWPPADVGELDANDLSLVLMLTHGRTKILFTGDIENQAMRGLLQKPEKLQADILIAPHHGSSESETSAFVKAVSPRVILSSNDRTLTGKQIRFESLVSGIPLLRTHDRGAITIDLHADGTYAITPHVPVNSDRK